MTAKLTEAEREELERIAGPGLITPGLANDLRAATLLRKKGLVELIGERREWEGGIGNRGCYVTFRQYKLTPAGRATLAAPEPPHAH